MVIMKTFVWNEEQICVFSYNVKQSPLGLLMKKGLTNTKKIIKVSN